MIEPQAVKLQLNHHNDPDVFLYLHEQIVKKKKSQLS